MDIHPIDSAREDGRLLELWSAVFGTGYPITPGWLRQQTVEVEGYQPGDHLVAEENGEWIGFSLTQVGAGSPASGSIQALGVHPATRRRGVGHALHAAALTRLIARGAESLHPGSGGLTYFWPGVPVELPGAWDFFHHLGWTEVERRWDLVRSLDDYTTPAWV